eukprot:5717272-Pyramimonas_sp.AAC.1
MVGAASREHLRMRGGAANRRETHSLQGSDGPAASDRPPRTRSPRARCHEGGSKATVGRRPTTVSCASWGPGCSGGPLPRGDHCSLRRSGPGAAAAAEPSRRRGPARR